MNKFRTVSLSIIRAVIKSIPWFGSGIEQATFGSIDALQTTRYHEMIQDMSHNIKFLVHDHQISLTDRISKEDFNKILLEAWKLYSEENALKPHRETIDRQYMDRVIDKDNILTSEEKRELYFFIMNDCLISATDISALKSIIVRQDGLTDYLGFYSYQMSNDKQDDAPFEGIIVLNITYLLTQNQRKEELAHNYAHHFIVSNILAAKGTTDNIDIVLKPYYEMRGISEKDAPTNYESGWNRNVLELLAEDYVYFFTPITRDHLMKDIFGYPPPHVKGFIRDLVTLE